MSHPDELEARQWVETEITRLRAASYAELLGRRNKPSHTAFKSSTARSLVGEVNVTWDGAQNEALRVLVDVYESGRGIVSTIASDDFIRASDDSFVGE
jgi:hypothetical protein